MKRLLFVALALALAAVACGDDDAGSTDDDSAGGSSDITIEGFDFGAPITASVGDTVTVRNADGVSHTWTAEDGTFDSGTLSGGDSFDHTFSDAGEFAFFCAIHPSMTGSITVSG